MSYAGSSYRSPATAAVSKAAYPEGRARVGRAILSRGKGAALGDGKGARLAPIFQSIFRRTRPPTTILPPPPGNSPRPPPRREFLGTSIAAGTVLATGLSSRALAAARFHRPDKLRILILGGTAFLGPACTEAA